MNNLDRHPGAFDIVTLRDARGTQFATRLSNVFVIGETESLVTLPKGKGIKLTIAEEVFIYVEKLMK